MTDSFKYTLNKEHKSNSLSQNIMNMDSAAYI